MAAILTTKEDAQGVEENIDPKNFHLWEQPSQNSHKTVTKQLFLIDFLDSMRFFEVCSIWAEY